MQLSKARERTLTKETAIQQKGKDRKETTFVQQTDYRHQFCRLIIS